MPVDYIAYIQQLDTLLDLYTGWRGTARQRDLSDIPETDRQGLVTRSVAAIERITGARSTYVAEVKRLIDKTPYLHVHTPGVMGVVQALRDDLKAGSIQDLAATVHADVFSNFLDMAQHLNDTGYKDAAAVITGSTLESHLRELAIKNGVAILDSHGKPAKASQLNADLAKVGAYNMLDHKSITAHLELRNNAAHGDYTKYTKDQVNNLISSITGFISRTPA
jgi:hypothetical protein